MNSALRPHDPDLYCASVDPRPGLFSPYDSAAFESPIEQLFAERLDKYASDALVIDTQHDVTTRVGGFRLDFLLSAEGRTLGIECDGAEFHDPHRDEWRDAVILAEGKLDIMVRFTGADLHRSTDTCLVLLSKFEPWVFSPRGLLNLETLAQGKTFSTCAPSATMHDAWWPVDHDDRDGLWNKVRMIRRVRTDIGKRAGEAPHWVSYADFALQDTHYANLDAMIAADKKRWTL